MNFLSFLLSLAAEKKEETWPTDANPCPFKGQHGDKPGSSSIYWIKGHLTRLCNNCLREKEKEVGAEMAYTFFNPDPDEKS